MSSRYSILFFFPVLTACAAAGQTRIIDSLKNKIYSAGTNEEKLQAVLLLCDQAASMSSDTLYSYVSIARGMAALQKNKTNQNLVDFHYATYLAKKGLPDSAIRMVDKILAQYKGDNDHKDIFLKFSMLKARLLDRGNKYTDELRQLYDVLNLAEVQKDTLTDVMAKTGIGWVQLEMQQYQDALNWFYKAMNTSENARHLKEYSALYSNVAAAYDKLGRNDSAEMYIDKAIAYAKETESIGFLATALNIQADIFIAAGRGSLAEKSLNEAVRIRKLINDPYYIVYDMSRLASLYAHNGQTDKGIQLSITGIEMAKRSGLTSQEYLMYQALAENYKAAGHEAKYAETLEKIVLLKDSLNNLNSGRLLADMQAKYDIKQKENVIMQQKVDLVKKNYFLYGSLLLLLLGVMITWLFWKEYRKRQKMKLQQVRDNEKRLSIQAVTDAEENQRKRIAADLHDNLGVQANAMLYNTELLKQWDTGKEELVGNLHDTAKEMLLNLRETLWAMKTTDVSAPDLWLRIISFSKQMGRHYATIKFTTEGTAPPARILASAKALNIVMIIQEAVNNAVKHSGTNRITVKSDMANTGWQIKIIDDGKGFDLADAASKNDSHGLNSIQERAKTAGLVLNIDAQKGSGTTIIITIT